MKATEIKNMPVDELNAKLDSLKEELFALRFQLAAKATHRLTDRNNKPHYLLPHNIFLL